MIDKFDCGNRLQTKNYCVSVLLNLPCLQGYFWVSARNFKIYIVWEKICFIVQNRIWGILNKLGENLNDHHTRWKSHPKASKQFQKFPPRISIYRFVIVIVIVINKTVKVKDWQLVWILIWIRVDRCQSVFQDVIFAQTTTRAVEGLHRGPPSETRSDPRPGPGIPQGLPGNLYWWSLNSLPPQFWSGNCILE